MKDRDFGCAHNTPTLVIDAEGTTTVAFYTEGTWWEGHPGGAKFQTDHPIVGLARALTDTGENRER